MKKFLFAILAVAVMFTGCKDDDEFNNVDQLQGLTITDYNGFSEFTAVRKENGDLKFEVMYQYDATEWITFDSFKFYYTVNQVFTDAAWAEAIVLDDAGTVPNLIDSHRVSMEIGVPATDNMYSFTIKAADVKVGDELRFYFRGYTKKLNELQETVKNKEYYTGTGDDTFDKDIYSQWTVLTIK